MQDAFGWLVLSAAVLVVLVWSRGLAFVVVPRPSLRAQVVACLLGLALATGVFALAFPHFVGPHADPVVQLRNLLKAVGTALVAFVLLATPMALVVRSLAARSANRR